MQPEADGQPLPGPDGLLTHACQLAEDGPGLAVLATQSADQEDQAGDIGPASESLRNGQPQTGSTQPCK